MIEKATVSVIIPTYNRAHVIEKSINSCINQTKPFHQIIIVDDGSTDNTELKIQKLIKDNNNIFYYKIENSGANVARNFGLSKNTSDYICFLDSDDLYLPQKTELQLSKLFKTQCDIVSCWVDKCKGNEKKTYKWKVEGNILKDILIGDTYIFNIQALFKKECFKNILFDPECVAAQEWDLHIRMAQKFTYSNVPRVLVHYNLDEVGNNIFRQENRVFHGLYYIFKKHKQVWLHKVGKNNYYSYMKKLLYSRLLFSDYPIINLNKLIILDYRFTHIYFKLDFIKTIGKRVFKKNNVK